MTYVCLRALGDTHFQIKRVVHHIHFHGVQAREDVTIIIIEVAHSIVIGGQALLQQFLVIYIALLHAQIGIKQVRGIDGIANPFDIAKEVLLPLLDVYVNVHSIFARGHYTV